MRARSFEEVESEGPGARVCGFVRAQEASWVAFYSQGRGQVHGRSAINFFADVTADVPPATEEMISSALTHVAHTVPQMVTEMEGSRAMGGRATRTSLLTDDLPWLRHCSRFFRLQGRRG